MSEESPADRFRTGWGFDAHALGGDPPLRLGGVIVSETEGVVATSDGDVLAHAVTDALMGACVLGDIGDHFPSEDPKSENADSMFFLRQAATMALASGWKPAHVDATLVAQSVRLAPHRDAVRQHLSDALDMAVDDISVKATTTDGLGFIGKDEGIAAVAVITVRSTP
jgi:2-C-methyl-D-erythritol 2,4-cyclodiphosphate synthase